MGKSARLGRKKDQKVGLLATPKIAENYKTADRFVFDEDTIEAATRGLFSGLRALDEAHKVDVIFAEIFPKSLRISLYESFEKSSCPKLFCRKVNEKIRLSVKSFVY